MAKYIALTVYEQIMFEAASKDIGQPLEAAEMVIISGTPHARWGSFMFSLAYDEDWLAEKGYL